VKPATESDSPDIARIVEQDGFVTVAACLSAQIIDELGIDLSGTRHAQRNLLDVPIVRKLATSKPVRALATAVIGSGCFAVRGILFNKTPTSNWKVVWHQDKTIAVKERKELPNFGPWSVKSGVVHVQPPPSVMGKMLAIRLHLDESSESNGPLRVVPGSHLGGDLSPAEVAAWRGRAAVTCTVPRGGAILMRPLLLHASSSSLKPAMRRVIHLEFAAEELPGGLEWHTRV
jgi:ectoine hydroxylase-related dioxygenase (phytanoyl-CoA dioxygenase family)